MTEITDDFVTGIITLLPHVSHARIGTKTKLAIMGGAFLIGLYIFTRKPVQRMFRRAK